MPTIRSEHEREHFDKLASNIGEAWWGHLTPAGKVRLQRRASIIKDQLKTITNPHILEIGCGAGALSKYILDVLPPCQLTCCDISPQSLEIAKNRCAQHTNASFDCADVTQLPYPDDSYDAIVGNSILHHVVLGESIKECFRLLRKGGSILFFEPNMLNPQVAIEKNIKFIGRMTQNSADETAFFRWPLAKELSQQGFINVNVRPFDFLHPIVPRTLIDVSKKISFILEKTPLLKEISGSLIITAYKK